MQDGGFSDFHETSQMNTNWNYPTAVRVGAGRLREVSAACRELGITAPLLVTDPGLLALPMVEQTVEFCRTAGLACRVFSEIKPNPTGTNVEQGFAVTMTATTMA